MISRRSADIAAAAAIADGGLALVTLALVAMIRFGPGWSVVPWDENLPAPLVLALAYATTWPLLLRAFGHYRLRTRPSLLADALVISRAALVMAAVVFGSFYFVRASDVSRLFLLVLFPTQMALSLLLKSPVRLLLLNLWRRGFDPQLVLIVGSNPRARRFANQLMAHPEFGVEIVGFLSEDAAAGGLRVLGSIEEIVRVIHQEVIDEVVVCLSHNEWNKIDAISAICQEAGKPMHVPLDLPEDALTRGRVEELDGLPVYSIVSGPDRALALAIKRLLDLVIAVLGLLIIAPVFVVVIGIMNVTQGRPILFMQPRVGLHGRTFTIVKLRTMRRNAEDLWPALAYRNEVSGHAFKLDDDPRVTTLGRWLRRTSLDEMPQLWNVLVGDMSLVGPRPPLPREVAAYDLWHRRRLSMKPGMTGLWQVRKRRVPEFDQWVRTDLEYIDRWSLWLDLEIILRTIPAVVSLSGR